MTASPFGVQARAGQQGGAPSALFFQPTSPGGNAQQGQAADQSPAPTACCAAQPAGPLSDSCLHALLQDAFVELWLSGHGTSALTEGTGKGPLGALRALLMRRALSRCPHVLTPNDRLRAFRATAAYADRLLRGRLV
jgi:hypothetical protein